MTVKIPNVLPPTSEQPAPTPSVMPTMDKTLEDGQIELTAGKAIPKLTFEEEQLRRSEREQAYRKAVSRKGKFHCPECDATIDGKVAYKSHLRSTHDYTSSDIEKHLGIEPKIYRCPAPSCLKRFTALRYLNQHARLKHGLSSKQLAKLRKPVAIVPEAPEPLDIPADWVKLLKANGITGFNLSMVPADKLTPELMAVLSKGKPTRKNELEAENRTARPGYKKSKPVPGSDLAESASFDAAMNMIEFQLLIPDDVDRRVFLLHHARGKSQREIAIEVFGDAAKKRLVQTILTRSLNSAMKWLKKAHREIQPESQEYPAYESIVNTLRGESSFQVFEHNIETFEPIYEEPEPEGITT